MPYFGQRCGPEGNRIPTIGLGFDEQIIDQVPMEAHDRLAFFNYCFSIVEVL